VSTTAQGLVLGLTLGTPTETARDDDRIQVVVTATRTEEEINRIPRSVTVIEREEIEEQTNLTRSLAEILGQVPGLNPSFREGSRVNPSIIRGREASILVDGVPLNANGIERPLESIDLNAIERIEIVRGANAIYGSNATGGTINLITRRPVPGELRSTIEVGVDAAAGRQFLDGDSFGNYLEYSFLGADESADLAFSLSRRENRAFFDGEGDRIFNRLPADDSQIISLLGTLGYNITDEQRLQVTLNYYDNERIRNRVIFDPDSDEKAQAIITDEQDFIGGSPPFDRSTLVNLSYRHDNLLGNRVQAQAYYNDSAGSAIPPGTFFGEFSSFTREFERWGGRLQIESPFTDSVSLLWGGDYDNNINNQETFVLYDRDEFEATGGRVFRQIGERTLVPPYDVRQLGLFAQLQWDITDNLLINGGLRYSNFNIQAPDYTTAIDNRDIAGGELSFDDVVFNVGTVYQVTNDLNLFASFSQGFDLPEFNRIFRVPPDGFSFEGGFAEVQPVRVNNYEVGVRGEWGNVQASLAGFYTDSALGSFLQLDPQIDQFIIARAPLRTYGVEATLDWQLSDQWQLGTGISWQEGDIDFEDDGNFQPFTSFVITPIKVTAYVENQTLPGWRNRLQALFVGSRDRAVGEFESPIESYFVLDWVSSLQVGPGTLNLGVSNLLDTQYIPANNQANLPGSMGRSAGRGRAINLNYRVTF